MHMDLLNIVFSGFLFSLVKAMVTEGIAFLIAINLFRASSAVVVVLNSSPKLNSTRYIVDVYSYSNLLILKFAVSLSSIIMF